MPATMSRFDDTAMTKIDPGPVLRARSHRGEPRRRGPLRKPDACGARRKDRRRATLS